MVCTNKTKYLLCAVIFFANLRKNSRVIHMYTHIATDEPLLRCRVKDFKSFCSTVQDIRSTIAYYRVYDTLFEVDSDDPPLQITVNDLQKDNNKMLGWAKIGWSKKYFCALNGFLYQFKEDVSSMVTNIPKAIIAWDLQIIDCVLDSNGQRSGSKYAVLLIVQKQTICLKFQTGPEAVKFYSALKQAWTDTRGRYHVNFSVDPPEITGEATGPQPIMPGSPNAFTPKQN